MVEYSERARAEVRARQKFFWNQKVHKIFYLLHILDVFISSKLMVLKRIELLAIWVKKSTTAGKKKQLPLKDELFSPDLERFK